MAFAFEELQVYRKSLDFAARVVKAAEEISSQAEEINRMLSGLIKFLAEKK
jgi:hypothetical protein